MTESHNRTTEQRLPEIPPEGNDEWHSESEADERFTACLMTMLKTKPPNHALARAHEKVARQKKPLAQQGNIRVTAYDEATKRYR